MPGNMLHLARFGMQIPKHGASAPVPPNQSGRIPPRSWASTRSIPRMPTRSSHMVAVTVEKGQGEQRWQICFCGHAVVLQCRVLSPAGARCLVGHPLGQAEEIQN